MRECATCKEQFDDSIAVCPHDATPLTPVGSLIGRIIDGRYRIETLLGSGGMGSVYKATQLNLDRTVAVKVISASLADPASFERFKREALVVAQLRHPNIVNIHDFGSSPDVGAYIVMEFLPGVPLNREIRRRGQLPIDEVVDITIQTCHALGEAHAAGVIHRDIKPQNIILETARDGVRVKVLDFGIAKLCEEAQGDGMSLTKSGAFLGTPSYMAPEQWSGEPADARADVYSLGCVMYEMLAGRPPFVHASTVRLLRMHAERTPVAPSFHRIEIDEALEAVVLRALAKSPDDRFASAAEFARALDPGATIDENSVRARATREGARTTVTTSATSRRQRAPLVGRDSEVAQIVLRLDAATGGECQFALLSGAAGIGKTRLLDELEDIARDRGVRVLHGRFAESDQALPYDGFFEVIREHLRSRTGHSGALNDVMPDLLTLFPMLAETEQGQTPPTLARSTLAETEPPAPDNEANVFETLATTMSRITSGRPLAIFLEDLQAASGSVEALEFIVRRLVATPILFVATCRSDEIDKDHPITRMLASFRGDRRFAHVEIEPLSAPAHRALVESFLGGEAEEELVARLFDVSGGNPYFAVELARSLLESGDLTGDGGEWRLSTGAGLIADALPETVQDAVRQRVAELPERAREVLTHAAIIGRDFDYEDLEALSGDVEDTIDRLLEHGFLEEDRRTRGDHLIFSSGVVREVVYASVPKRKRRALHLRHAEDLEERFAGKLDRVLPALANHYIRADVAEKVFEYGMQLARRSLAAHVPDDAQRVAIAVLEFAREEGEVEIEAEAHMLLGEALAMRGVLGAAVQEYEQAVRGFEQCSRDALAVSAMERAAATAWEARQTAKAERWIAAGIAAARAAIVTDTLARLLSLGATIANLGGDFDRARKYSDEAATLRPSLETGGNELAKGGRLIVATSGELRPGLPSELLYTHEFEVSATAYEPLFTWNSRGAIVPLLAESWTVSEDGREFVFALRGGVTMHDGNLFTSETARRSLEFAARAAGRAIPSALSAISGVAEFVNGSADHISGIDTPSSRELRIRLDDPLPIYPALLTDPRTAIAGERPADGSAAPGTGPFVVRSMAPLGALLERHDAYWSEAPALDALEFRCVPRSSDRASAVRSGEIDLVGGLEPSDLAALLQLRPIKTSFVESPVKSTTFLLFRSSGRAAAASRALTGVVRVRELVRSTLGRVAQPAEGLLPPGILGHDPGRRRIQIDRGHTAEQLTSLGVDHLVHLRAAISPSVQARYGALLDALFAEWKELGFSVSVETQSFAEHMRSFDTPSDFDFTLQEWEADYDDPDTFTYALFHSKHGAFAHYLSSPELDVLIERARLERQAPAREELYRQIENALVDSGLFLPLFHRVDYRVAAADVRRVSLESAPPFVAYARIGKAADSAQAIARPSRVTIHIPLPSDFPSIDPCEVTSVAAIEPSLAVFETLVRPNAEAHVEPWLAAEFRLEERGRRYAFRLRDDVRFHDGTRLTARDVRHTFERLLRSAGDYAQLLYPVLGAEAFAAGQTRELEGFRIGSATEFEIEMETPLSILPALLTCAAAAIVPDGTTRTQGTWQTGCVGTGPFRVAYAASSGRLELEANPFYWRRGYPRSEKLAFTSENQSAARAAGFREGKYSVAWLLARADEDALLRDHEIAARGMRVPEVATTMLVLNSRKGPFADESVRRRFARALEVETFVRRVEGAGAVPARGLIPPGLLGHDALVSGEVPTITGESSEIVRLTASLTPPLRTAWGAEFVRWLGERGFAVRLVTETYAEHEAAISGGLVDIAATGWNFDYPDADSIVYGALHSASRFGGKFISHPEIDRLADMGRTETDPDARRTIYREVEELVARSALLIPLYYQRRWFFPGPKVEGIELNLFQPYLSYEKLLVRE